MMLRPPNMASPFSLCFFFVFLSGALADDSAVMANLRKGLTPMPSGWNGTDFCNWSGINCGKSGESNDRVTAINMGSKGLSGTLPSDLNQLSQLVILSFQGNSLSGSLPSLANLQFLQRIYLDGNNFTSIDKDFFTNLTSLQTVSLGDNIDLAPWSIPDVLSQSKSLAVFYASNVNFHGSIPDWFGSMPSLKELRLSYNNLTGSLPSSLSGTSIQKLWLNNQAVGISGTIDVLAAMTDLTQVWLQQNAFTGPIPDLSNCPQLFDLQLRDNQFSGIVPSSLINLPQLTNVSLRNNKLQGPLPVFAKGVSAELDNNKFCRTDAGPCDSQVTTLLEVAGALGYPTTLADSWLGNNACANWLSISCDNQEKNVTIVNFSKKGFTGTISPAFANLTSLRTLILNDNNLTGSIPQSLTGLTQLQVLDVSNNNLTGEIPKFRDGVKLTTSGNLLLGKGTDSGSGGSPSPGTDSTDTSAGSSNGSTPSAGVIVAIVVAVIIFIGVVLFVSYKCYARKRHQKFGRVTNPENGKEMVVNKAIGGTSGYGGVPTELQSQSSGDHSDLPVFEGGNIAISIQVLRQVTDNFSEDNVLGRGGFGVVYKGELHDGTKIAVKRMESAAMGTKGMNEFQAEIAVLTKVRHRHLVALLGFCVNGNERLLVYEYMPQGTLGQHLFDWCENGYSPLTWKQRVSIALDVGRGVEYLHSLAQQSFIHRDLKPSNILLGDDMRAKVADFGLVKHAPDGKYSVETRLAGTFGYLAPEYAVIMKIDLLVNLHCFKTSTGRVTTKVDVYAFGVVLMELITGRKALDETMPDERSHLVSWFRRVLINKDNLQKAIDQTLDLDEETLTSIYKVAELAGHCTAREPYQRPEMSHAVNILGPLVEQWKPARPEEDESYGIDLHTSLPQALQRWQHDEGTSMMLNDLSYSRTQGSIPSKPSGFADTFDSMDCR